MSFDRLIRFVDGEGRTAFGNLDKPFAAKEIIGTEVQVLVGTFQYGFTKTSEKRTVKKVRRKASDLSLKHYTDAAIVAQSVAGCAFCAVCWPQLQAALQRDKCEKSFAMQSHTMLTHYLLPSSSFPTSPSFS